MVGFGGLSGLIAYYEDYKYYPPSVFIRSFFVLFFFFLYFQSDDPFVLVLNATVLIGLLPSIYVLMRERKSGAAASSKTERAISTK